MIKTVFFDWNGTLLADASLRFRLTNQSLAILGHPEISRAYYQLHHRIPVSEFYKNLGISEEVIREKGEEERIAFHDGYKAAEGKLSTRGGTAQLLRELQQQGVTCVILSNHTVSGIKEQLTRLKLSNYFSAILANDDIHASANKGKKDLLAAYLKQENLNPAETLIIGDTMEETIIGHELGLKTVAITGGVHTRGQLASQKPDAIIGQVYALIDVIKEMDRE